MNSESTSGGLGLCSVLFIVFLILKLIGVIHWSWWWVFAPYWIPIGIFVAVAVIAILVGLIAAVLFQ